MNIANKLKKLNVEEAYKLGYRRGFGKALARAVQFIHLECPDIDVKQVKDYILKKETARK